MDKKDKISLNNKMVSYSSAIKSSASKLKGVANNMGITAENIKHTSTKIGKGAVTVGSKATNVIGSVAVKSGETAASVASGTIDRVKQINFNNYQFDTESVLKQVMKIPGVKVDREKFLKKELSPHHSLDIVHMAISKNPAYAGIDRNEIKIIANQIINYETNRVSSVSFLAGMPGGFAMAATIPGDVLQYFIHVVIVMQKLAYLYGFDDFQLSDFSINDDTFNQIMVFLGVMMGVQGTNAGVKIIADSAAKKIARALPQKALTKGAIYPIVKNVAKFVGIKMTKDIFAKSISKVVPVVGGVVSGGITYAMFKPSCYKLQNSFNNIKLSDPEFYKDIYEN